MPTLDRPRPTADRRIHPRQRCRIPVRGAMPGRTTDLSAGGARIQRLDDGALEVGQALDLEFSLPDGPLHARAEVVTVDDDALFSTGAVRFAALAPENIRRLRALVQRRAMMRPGARPLARIALQQVARA